MRILTGILIGTVLIFITSCCHPYYRALDSKPSHTDGWKNKFENNVHTIGSFVLNKGESTEGDKLGVTLIDLAPGRYCYAPFAEPTATEIRLRFYDLKSKESICETTIFAIGASGGGSFDCPEKINLPSGFYLRRQNVKEGWIWLELME